MRDKKSLAYQYIQMIAVVGDFPADELKRMDGGEQYRGKVITDLKGNKCIKTYHKDNIRSFRLTAKSKQMLLEDMPSRFSFYFNGGSDTNQIRSSITRRLRLHRIAQTIITMKHANIAFFLDEKPDIFGCGVTECSPQMLSIPRIPAFYSSREIKNTGIEANKIRGTRAVGALLTASELLLVHNTGDVVMKWDVKSEMRIKAVLRNLCNQQLPKTHANATIKAIMLGTTIGIGYQLLTSSGGAKHNYFMLDGSFEHFHYITHDHAGAILLKLLCNTALRAKLNDILTQDLSAPDAKLLIENDGIDESGNPLLLAYDFNMPRLARFNTALRLQNRHGTAICFDYQREALSAFFGERVTIQTIDLQKFERGFFP